MSSFDLIYPERRRISSSELLLMGQQAYDAGDLLVRPLNGTEAAEMLSQEGIVTLARRTPTPIRR
jgi:hypothetical protein